MTDATLQQVFRGNPGAKRPTQRILFAHRLAPLTLHPSSIPSSLAEPPPPIPPSRLSSNILSWGFSPSWPTPAMISTKVSGGHLTEVCWDLPKALEDPKI